MAALEPQDFFTGNGNKTSCQLSSLENSQDKGSLLYPTTQLPLSLLRRSKSFHPRSPSDIEGEIDDRHNDRILEAPYSQLNHQSMAARVNLSSSEQPQPSRSFHYRMLNNFYRNRIFSRSNNSCPTFENVASDAVAKSNASVVSSMPSTTITMESVSETFVSKLALCFAGLQASYLSWAYLQEFIMTVPFNPTPHNPSGRFPSASFCVFCNRCVALTVALVVVRIRHGAFFANSKAPISAFLPCALSNTVSSISQYASLQYVSFPVMTVFKSSIIIPVMIMGYLIKGATYPIGRYIEAAVITAGVAIFSFYSLPSSSENSTPFGISLLLVYVFCESFTSQWQDKIYSHYGRENVDPYQMMLGIDAIAIVFTMASLILSGELPVVWEFFQANPHVSFYSFLCPLASTCGQLCIFWTIKEFGPVVFTLIMTTRKLVSIAISTLAFGHVIQPEAALGGALVLAAIFHGINHSSRKHHDGNTKKDNYLSGRSLSFRSSQSPATSATDENDTASVSAQPA